MVNRIVLNETSYFGPGAISVIPTPGNPRDTTEAEILEIYKQAFK